MKTLTFSSFRKKREVDTTEDLFVFENTLNDRGIKCKKTQIINDPYFNISSRTQLDERIRERYKAMGIEARVYPSL